jgi:serine/threonine protein phosphatase PrpC
MMVTIESAGITDVGRRRDQNEDSLFIDDGMGLYVVADGMGGHKAGEVASKLSGKGRPQPFKRSPPITGRHPPIQPYRPSNLFKQ